jgi:hypothetical protein
VAKTEGQKASVGKQRKQSNCIAAQTSIGHGARKSDPAAFGKDQDIAAM